MLSRPRSPENKTKLLTSRNGVAASVPLRITRMRPPCSTTNRRVVSPGGWVKYNGALKPFATNRRAGGAETMIGAEPPLPPKVATTLVATFGGSGGPAPIIVSATPALPFVPHGVSPPLYFD